MCAIDFVEHAIRNVQVIFALLISHYYVIFYYPVYILDVKVEPNKAT